MNKRLSVCLIACVLAGCASHPSTPEATATHVAPPATQPAIAIVNGQPIAQSEFMRPLIDAYGLNILLDLVQLESAKQAAYKNGLTVTEDDVKAEMQRTLDTMFRDNNAKNQSDLDIAIDKGQTDVADQLRKQIAADDEQLLGQFLTQQHLSREEFELVIRTNAYLRKIVEPTLKGAITEQMLQDGFRFQYGEKVRVWHIQLANLNEVGQAKKMLAGGESFPDVAREISRDPKDAPDGGELPPFSRQDPRFPTEFKEVAFALKPGEVSDPVLTNGAYQLIKLEKRIAPVAVKYEDHKEIIRRELEESLLANGMKQLRNELAQDALKSLQINDPDLRAQFEKKVSDANASVKGREETLKKLQQEREAAEAAAATQPATTAPGGGMAVPAPLPHMNGATGPAAPAQATMPASVPTTTPAR